MENKSVISIVNKQIINSEEDNIKITTTGSYIKKNKKCYITYEDSKGYKSVSINRIAPMSVIKVESPNLIIINKKEEKHVSQLILEKGKRHYCQYKNELGCINLVIYTKQIDCDLRESEAYIYVKYFMDINASVTSLNKVYISVKETNGDVEYINNVN